MKRSRLFWGIVALLLVSSASLLYLYFRFTALAGFNREGERPVWLYVYPDMEWADVVGSVEMKTDAPLLLDLKWHLKHRAKKQPTVGAYTIEPNMTVQALYNRLVYGMQTKIGLNLNSSRLPSMIYSKLDNQLLLDSASIARAMRDSSVISQLGIKDTTVVYYLIPDVYEVYWTITPKDLVEKLVKKTISFWNDERISKANRLGLSRYEVINLAAIVQEESSKEDEYPMIAGLYINRLKLRMPLQADPTVKFALQDFSIRRVMRGHLSVDSPYNTYRVVGLPKGPIRIPSPEAIDGVLNATDHPYIYMCARSDFSGYHAFADTYSEHLKNAALYSQELNRRGIN